MTQTHLSQHLLDQSKDLIWVVNLDLQLIYTNKAYVKTIREVTGIEIKLNDSVFMEGFEEGYFEKWKLYYSRAFTGEFIEIEEHFYHPENNEIQYGQNTFEPLIGDDNKVFAVACQWKDITRIVKQRSEANQMMDASLDVFCSINEQGNFVNISAEALNHWGYAPEELRGKPYVDFILEDDVSKTNEIAAAILSGQEIKSFTNRYKKKDGGIAYNIWSATWDNQAKLMYCVARDGKEKLEQEEKILQSEHRFKTLVQEGSDLIGIIDIAGNYLYVSPTSYSVLGFAPEEFIGRSVFEFIHPDDVEKALSVLQKINTEIRINVEPFRVRNNKNEWRWIETVLTNMLDNSAVKGIVANSRDITSKIEQEEKIQQSEQRFKSLVQEGSDLIGILDTEGNYLDVSPTSFTILGIAPEEFIGRNAFEFIHPDDADRILAGLQKVIIENRVTVQPFRFQNNKKEWRWIETVFTNMLNNPAVNGIVANSRDVTESVNDRKLIEANEQFNRSVLESSPDCLKVLDVEGRIQYMNYNGLCQMEIDDFTTIKYKNWWTLWGDENEELVRNALAKALTGETAEFTAFCPTAKGKPKWWDVSVSPVGKPGEAVVQIISVSRDVTERISKEQENDLIAQISSTFSLEDGYANSIEKLCKTISVFGNFDWVELWTCNLDKSHMQLINYYLADPKDEVFYELTSGIRSFKKSESLAGKVWAVERQFQWNDLEKSTGFVRKNAAQTIGIKSVLGIPLVSNNEVVGVLSIGVKNNSNYKEKYSRLFKRLETFIGAELKRKMLENDLSHLYNAIPDIIGVKDYQGRVLKINKAVSEILGYGEEELLYRNINDFVHPDDREIARNELEKLGSGQKNVQCEIRFIAKNGTIIWLSWQCTPSLEEGVIYFTAKNITEEKKLIELNRQTRQLAKIGSWELDMVNQVLYWSDEVHQLHETDPNSFVPDVATATNFYREDFRDLVNQIIEKTTTTGEPFDFEAVIVTANKNEIWIRVIGTPEFLNNQCIRIYGSFQDIHERKEAEIAVQQSESRFRSIFEIASLGIAQVDPSNGQILLINSFYEVITGYSVAELLNMSFFDFTHPDDRELDWEIFSKAALGELEYRNEKRYVKKDGSIVWVKIHLAFIRDEMDKPVRTVAICEDITERKDAELRLQVLADNLPGVVFQYYINTDGTNYLSSVSKGAKQLWGFSAEEVMQNSMLVWNQTAAGGDIDAVQKSISDSIEYKTKWSARWKYVMPTGEIKTHLGYGSPRYLADGTVVFDSVILDVTLEAKNEVLLEQVINLTKIGSWELDLKTMTPYFSEETFRIYELPFGLAPKVEDGINFYAPEAQPIIREAVAQAIENQTPYDIELPFVTAKGKNIWVRTYGNAEVINGKTVRLFGAIQDITESKNAEDKLAYSEQKYRLLAQQLELNQTHLTHAQQVAKVGSWETSLRDLTVTWSDETYRIFGIVNDGADKTHENFLNIVHPLDREKVDQAFIDSIRDSNRSYHLIEHRILTKTGEEKVVEERWRIEFDDNGVPLLAIGSCQDITDRKIAEEERNSLQTTLENSLNEIYIFDDETFKFSYVNKGALRNLGYSENEIEALTPLDLKADFTLASFKELVSPLINNEKKEIIFFTSHKRKDGSFYPVEVHLQSVSVGNNKRFVAIILDITQRKKAEELLTQASEIAKLGSWEMDLLLQNDDEMYLSKMVREILEVDDSFIPTLKAGLEFYNGKNGDKVQQAINNLIETGLEFDEELLIRTAKGNSKWVRIIGKSLRVDNKCTKIYGSFQDVDELKGAVIKLEKSFKELEDYKFSIDQSAIIAFTNEKGVITDVNDNFCDISGYNRNELIGKTHQLVNSSYHPREFFIDLWKTISSGKVWRGEVQNKSKDGLFYWVYTTIVPFLDEKNKPFKYLAIRFDITARKKAEEDIKFKANLLNTIEQAAIATNLDGIVNYWNKAAESIYGWSLEEAIRQNIVTLTTPEPSKEQAMQIMERLKKGQTWSGNFRVRKKDGTEFIALVSNSPVYDENNILSGIIGVSTDVTQQIKNEELLKQYNQQLESSNERFEKVTEATNDVIWDWDLINQTYFRSKAIERFFGKEALKLLTGEDLWVERFHSEDLSIIQNSVQEALANPLQDRWELEYRVMHENGNTIYVIDRGIIVRNEEGIAIRMVGAMTDISEQKKLAVQLAELNQSLQKYTIELERSNEELEQFAFVASHDLQEPLRMISSFMNQLKRKYENQLDEKAQQYIYFATDGAKRMKQIILDLLQFSRTGRPTDGKEEVDLNEVISEFIQLRRKLISEKKAYITFQGLPTLNTYKAAITQIIHCLIDNALKYSKADTEPVVKIKAKENENEWEFSIQDNGIGIEAQFYDKIFIIFQRLHNKEDYGGTGIGLSIAKRHVEFLGGRIWLESAVGKGTTFYFTIPKTTHYE